MIEVRIHGRGGQGAVVAGKILACALFKEGKWVQSFPMFGVERRGAPVAAFTRFDDEKILVRNNIYEPEHVVVLDPTLLSVGNVTDGLKKEGWIVVNARGALDDSAGYGDFQIARVDANAIATEYKLGSVAAPIVNTAILGGFARATGLVSIDAILDAIRDEVPIMPEQNAKAARQAYDTTVLPS